MSMRAFFLLAVLAVVATATVEQLVDELDDLELDHNIPTFLELEDGKHVWPRREHDRLTRFLYAASMRTFRS